MARRAGTPKATPKPAPEGHNSSKMSEAEKEALFVGHLNACRAQNKIMADAMEGLKAIRSSRRKVRETAREDGFPLAKIDDILKKEGQSQKDLQAEAELFHWMDSV